MILIDTDVLIDVALDRQPFSDLTADMLARPTPVQAKAFRLLGVRP